MDKLNLINLSHPINILFIGCLGVVRSPLILHQGFRDSSLSTSDFLSECIAFCKHIAIVPTTESSRSSDPDTIEKRSNNYLTS